ncbi:thiamine pyrophosphate-binding protein [Microlunatus ginsengisoli]|uniref:Thiamine pyrophosphate-binding protein n=1 Tax=Microlunatus ginsengisoli TaxID=363863 RepID=A0ABP6ZKL2_9ACTN
MGRLGIGHAFGVVGSGNLAMTNALRDAGVPYVAARHEAGATTMADAYARTSGTVTLASVHQGPGLTNAITGIAEAAKSRTPLIVLAGDTAGAAVRSNFRIDQDALVRAVGAVPERVHSAASAVADVTRAWRTARNSRRTVVLSVPLDIQAGDAELTRVDPLPPPVPVRPGRYATRQLADLLTTARRPVFIAGRGAVAHRKALRDLAVQSGALLATSAVAKGAFAGDRFDLGISGGFATPLAAELIGAADLVVAWGCSLTMWTTRHGRLIGDGTVVVQVDDDEPALGANRPVSLGVHGDVGETARAVQQLVPVREPDSTYRTEAVAERIAADGRWSAIETDDLSTAETIDPRLLSRELEHRLPADRVLAIDSGNFMGYPAAYLSAPDPAAFCFTQSFQSIGLGLATGIGAALASPGRLPVVASGDGGFLMSIADLETAVRLGLPLVVVVYNDHAYGAEVHHFTGGDDLSTVTFPDGDLAAIARGFGADAMTVRTRDDLDQLDVWLAVHHDRPLVIDAKISSDGGSWWLAEAFRGH